MAQQKKPTAKKKAAPKKAAPKKTVKAAPVQPAKPTYERLLTARRAAEKADADVKVAIRHLNRAKSFHGDLNQRDRLVAEASDNLALARENATEARANFDRLSMEAKR